LRRTSGRKLAFESLADDVGFSLSALRGGSLNPAAKI
jgi:hypothetical protein